MIRRFYVHNFRCLENFELPIAGRPSVLLIGKNGAGKSTIGRALKILQKIADGTSRIDEVLKPKDFARGRADAPMRFELEVTLNNQDYQYSIAFDLPPGLKELRVFDEALTANGGPVLSVSWRKCAFSGPVRRVRLNSSLTGILRRCRSFRNRIQRTRCTSSSSGLPARLSCAQYPV